MTPTQINTTIAESMGIELTAFRFRLSPYQEPNKLTWSPSYGSRAQAERVSAKEASSWSSVCFPVEKFSDPNEAPAYTTDLNACAEFEATLTKEPFYKYRDELVRIVVRDAKVSYKQARGDAWCYLISAKAPQRCEAYLRTLNLWTA